MAKRNANTIPVNPEDKLDFKKILPIFVIVLIDLLGEKGDLSRVAMASAEEGPEPEPEQDPPPSAVIAPEDLALLRRVLSSGRPILVGKNAAGGSVHGSVGNVALGAKSLMLLPLMSTKGPVGVLTLISTKSARRFAAAKSVEQRPTRRSVEH